MKAAILTIVPDVQLVDVTHDVERHDVTEAALALEAAAPFFPPASVHVAVVDPGVGTARRGMVLESGGHVFIGPDNGLFELVARRAPAARSWEIRWRPEMLSASFHGRDLFAPVAGQLARGELPGDEPRAAAIGRRLDWPDDLPEIAYIDRFGNAMTGFRAAVVAKDARLSAGGRVLGRARTFADAPPGQPFWYENSNGLVEIAVNAARADAVLGLTIGSPIEILS